MSERQVIIPTGIVRDWPSPKTGKIYRSSVFETLMGMDFDETPVRGVIGDFPEKLTKDELHAIRRAIDKAPNTAKLVGFQVNGEELHAIVEAESDEAFSTLSAAPWKIRMIIDYGDAAPKGYEVETVRGVVAFWLELEVDSESD